MGLFFQQVELGPMANYVYLIGDSVSKELAVVDPAWDVAAIRKIAADQGYAITKALITHGHPDHINAVEDLLDHEQVKVYMHKDEVPWIKGWKETAIATSHLDEIEIGSFKLQVLHTPGHTEGSQCFMLGNQIITGDTLFIDGCGRTDLPGGDPEVLYDTFSRVIKDLPEDTMIYPGHNYALDTCQTLKQQLQTNPYLQAHSKQAFLSMVRPGFKSL